MARWKLRIAGGLALLSLLAFSPLPSRAGWRTKAEKRPKAPPTDCQFGFYGTNWRAWPEGCNTWPGCADQSQFYATPFAPPANSFPPTWSNPTQAAPSPWSTYREFLPPQNSAPIYSVPQNSLPPQFAPPNLPQPSYAPSLPPPSGPAPTVPPAAPPLPGQPPTPPVPQATRNWVPPAPTTMTPSSSSNGNGVQQVGAWNRNGSASPVVTLGAPLLGSTATVPPPAINRTSALPAFSSVPRSLIAPKDTPLSRPTRTQNPVTLLPPQ